MVLRTKQMLLDVLRTSTQARQKGRAPAASAIASAPAWVRADATATAEGAKREYEQEGEFR